MRENRKERFGIRKYSIGVTSALLGVLLFLGTNNDAQAAENSQTSTELAKVTDQHQQAAEMGEQAKSEETTASQLQDKTSSVTSSSDAVKEEASTQSIELNQASPKQVEAATAPSVSKPDEKDTDVTSKVASKELNTVDAIPASINQTEGGTKETNNVFTNPVSETKAATPDVAPTTLNVSDSNYQNNPSSTPTPVDAPLAVTNENIINPTNRNEEEPIEEVKFGVRSIADGEVSVSSWAELVKAVNNPSVKKVVATSNITATSNLDIPVNRNVEIEGSTLNLGDYQIVPNAQSTTKFSNLTLTGNNKKGIIASQNVATVELNNVKHTGADLVNAKALNVIVSGHTTSTVTTANNRIALNSEANIYAANLEIAKDSTLTINRNAGLQGDLIHLADNGKVELKDNATLNATLNGQRRDAAVRVSNNGHFVTGAHSNVNLTTNNSRGIVLGQKLTGELPAGSEASYAKSDFRNNQANELTLGRYTTMNFNGREAVLMGHNATFKTGESSNITFNNTGDGVAFDMGDEAHFTVEPHAVMHLNSTGKKHSGNWQYSNYIGLDNNGKIRIEHDSEVYLNLTDRGTHPYNDTVNINSTKPGSQPYFYVGDNAVLDIQDSSPDYYAELISVPLPGSTEGTFEFDQVKYLNLQKHTNIIGHLGNGNLIFMDTRNGKFLAHGPFIAKQWDNRVHSETPSNVWQPVEDISIPWRNFNPSGKIEGTLYGNPEEPISDHDKKFSDKFNPQKSQRIVLQGIKIPAEHVYRKVEPIPFEIEKVFNPNLNPNEEIVVQKGVIGEKEIIKKTYTLDGKPDPNKPDVTEENITKTPVKQIVEYGPVYGEPIVEKTPIPFEKERVFDASLPVSSPDKLITAGENGEKTKTTPVLIDPITHQKVGEDTPVEEITKQPVNEVVHFAPVAVPHKDTEVFDPSVPTDQKEVTPGEDGLKNPETNEIVKQPKDGVTKYGPKTGTPEVVKEPIPFETKRVFDVNMPVGTPDKTVTEGENGEKTITTPVTVNPLTGEELSKGTPVEEVTKQPVNKVVHFAPVAVPHKDTEVFDPSIPADQKEVTPGEDGLKNPETNEIVKQPKDGVTKYGPKTGTPEVVKEPIPFETERVFDVNMPVGTPDKTVTEGENGEKTITTPVTVNPLTGEELSKGTPVEEITKQPVNKVVHFAPVAVPHKDTEVFDPSVPADQKEVTPGEDGLKNPETNEIVKQPKDGVTKYGPKTGTPEVVKEPIPFETERVFDVNMPVGTPDKTVTEGENGEKTITTPVTVNPLTGEELSKGTPVEEITKQPVNKVVHFAPVAVPHKDTEVFDPSVPADQKEVTPGEDGLKNPETNEIVKQPKDGVTKYGPKTGTPEVVKEPIPFETERVFDVNMPVGTPDKTVTEGENGEKTITTPVTVNPLTGEELSKGTPVEEITKQPVNKVVHFAPVAVPHKDTEVFDPSVPADQKEVTPGEDGLKNPETNEIVKQPKDGVTKYGPKTGTPEVEKAPIPFETERVFDVNMPVGTPDKTVTEGENGEKTITTPVTVNPLTGEELSKGTPVEEVTKQPVNKVVHFAPVAVPHKDTEVFDPSVPADQKEVTPGEDGLKNPETNEIVKQPKDGVTKYGPKTGTPEVEKEPIPFETERVFDVNMPVGTPDKTVTEGENGEKTITTPVTVNPLTGEELSKGTPVEEVTKQPVNKVVHFAPVAVPHKDTEVFDPSVPADQKEVTPGEDGLKNPETNEIVKQPKDGVTKYGPKTGTPEVLKEPIPFETERVFDETMPVNSPDKIVTKGENGEKTITTPVTVNPLTGEELSKGTPVEEITKQPVNEVVHVAPKVLPHKTVDIFDPTLPAGETVKTPGEDGIVNPLNGDIIKAPKDEIVRHGTQPQNGTYEPEVKDITKPYGEPTTEDEVKNNVKVPGFPTEGEQPKVTLDDPTQLPDGNTPGTTPVDVTVTYPDGTQDHVKVPVHVGEQPQNEKYEPEVTEITKPFGDPTTEDEVKNNVKVPGFPTEGEQPKVTLDDPTQLPDGNTPGTTPVDVTVTYPDGTQDHVKVPVHVGDQADNEKYEPEVTEITKPFGDPTTEDEVKNNVKVPGFPTDGEQPKVTVDDPSQLPDGNTPGTTPVDVTVTYPDGTQDHVKVPVHVGDQADNEKYEPEVTEITKPFGEPTTEDEVKNNVKVPGFPTEGEQPKVTLDDPTQLPDGNTPGTTPVDVTVTYPDGTQDHVKVPVTVYPQLDADVYTPAYNDVQANPGEIVKIPQVGDKVPDGTQFEIPKDLELKDGWTATVDPKTGELTVTVPQNAEEGEVATIKVIVTYPDGTKDVVEVNVTVHDTIAPEAPFVNPIEAGDKVVTGTGKEPGTKVTVTFPDGSTVTTTVDKDGNWKVDVPSNVTLKDGDVVKAVITDEAGNTSDETVTPVKDTIAPEAPVVNPIEAGDKVVTGTGKEPGTKVTVTFPDGSTVTTTVDKDGNWKVDVPSNVTLKDGDVVKAVITDEAGNTSDETVTPVKDTIAPEAPVVNTIHTGDKVVTGTAEPGAKVTVTFPDGSTVTTTVDKDGNWKVDVPFNVTLKDGDKVTAVAIDEVGNVSKSTTVIVVGDKAGVPTPHGSKVQLQNSHTTKQSKSNKTVKKAAAKALPETGEETTNNGVLFGGLFAAIGSILLFRRRRHHDDNK